MAEARAATPVEAQEFGIYLDGVRLWGRDYMIGAAARGRDQAFVAGVVLSAALHYAGELLALHEGVGEIVSGRAREKMIMRGINSGLEQGRTRVARIKAALAAESRA